MKIAITGATGLIGTALTALLREEGHEVSRLLRSVKGAQPGDIYWNPAMGELEPATLEGLDAVIHLSGENVGERWTDEQKQKIRASRIDTTRLLCNALAGIQRKPALLISASAVGIYGLRGNEILDESSHPGTGFLAELGKEWEAATQIASEAGIRVINARFGVVLNPAGGVLAKLMGPFKLGAGGKVGSGEQWVSWIARDDLVHAISFLLGTQSLSGPINLTSPNPVTNEELATELGKAMGRPSFATIPATFVRLAFGREMADETVLASQRVLPTRLREAGYEFRHPTLPEALRFELATDPG